MKQCRKCNVLLTELTWSDSRRKKSDYICKGCKSGQMSNFREYQREVEELTKGISRCSVCKEVLSEENTYPCNKSTCKRCCNSRSNTYEYPIEQRLWWGAASRAKKKGIPFNIEVSDIIVPKTCPVFGVPLERSEGSKGATDNSPTLDKIIPELGYVKGNICVISWKANRLKSNGTLEDFLKIVSWLQMVSHQKAA